MLFDRATNTRKYTHTHRSARTRMQSQFAHTHTNLLINIKKIH